MDGVITIIGLLFLHLHLFVLIFDKLKTGPRPMLFSSEPLLTGQLPCPQEWLLNRGSTILSPQYSWPGIRMGKKLLQ